MCGSFAGSLGELQGCRGSLRGFSKSLKSFQSFIKFTEDTEKVYFVITSDSFTAKKRVKQYANLSEGHLGEPHSYQYEFRSSRSLS